MSIENNNSKKWGYFSLFLFFVGILIGVLDYLYLGKYFVLITILSFAMLAASIGMFWESHKRISKYLSVLLLATAGLFLYWSTAHLFYAVISFAFVLMVIVEDMRTTRQKREG